ncbi:MAG: glycosyltransferase, partial [Acetatifactor sp.]|nr:glycosyltransferase [Acetatifactor sp.]
MCTGEKQTDVSVIIPIYNQESQILQGIKGLMREQTAFCRIEILLINDGSTDKIGEICQKLADKHPQIRYFEQSNPG